MCVSGEGWMERVLLGVGLARSSNEFVEDEYRMITSHLDMPHGAV